MANDVRKAFLTNLEYYMNKSGLDRKQFAEKVGIGYSTVTAWFCEFKYPRPEKIKKIADFFEIPISCLTEVNSNPVSKAETAHEVQALVDDQYKKADLLKQLLSNASKLNISQLECLLTMATTLSAQ